MIRSKLLTYQELIKNTTTPITILGNYEAMYYTIGLTNEAGEVAGVIKKIMRDKQGRMGLRDRTVLAEELGDTLWYLTQLASSIGYSLEEIASINLKKIGAEDADNV